MIQENIINPSMITNWIVIGPDTLRPYNIGRKKMLGNHSLQREFKLRYPLYILAFPKATSCIR